MYVFEMLTGERPFQGDSMVETFVSILQKEPDYPKEISDRTKSLLESMLKKEREERTASAEDLVDEIENIQLSLAGESENFVISNEDAVNVSSTAFATQELSRLKAHTLLQWPALVVIVLFLVGIGLGAYLVKSLSDVSWAKEALVEVEDLVKEEKYFEAHDLAEKVSQYIPESEKLKRMSLIYTDSLSVRSEPSGAKVFVRRFIPGSEDKVKKEFLGTTPLAKKKIARGDYLLEIQLEGHRVFRRTISGTIPSIGKSYIGSPPIDMDVVLSDESDTPENMVFVPGGEYELNNWSRLPRKKVNLSEFYIDEYETTNEEFKEFIEKGGYQTARYWIHPFVKDGKEISVSEATSAFIDKTGLPGPRTWSNQNYPEGKDDHPVTGITWYEAAAYAAFRGKDLPTVFQWEKAARFGISDPRYNSMPWGLIRQGDSTESRANFSSSGTRKTGSFEFGMSPFGVYDMAGNVSEWVLNRSGDDYVTRGGAWNDLPYTFGGYGQYPGFYASDKLGFRCVKNASETKGQGDEELMPETPPVYEASTQSQFKEWAIHYDYDRKPINPRTVKIESFQSWTREKIEFIGDNDQIVTAYLFLPKFYERPLQVVHYIPPGDVVRGIRSLTDSVDMFLGPVIKSGRAVFVVELNGYLSRPYPKEFIPPEKNQIGFRKQNVNWLTDLRIGLDYLETRSDIDADKISLLGISNGANLSILLLPVETRYKAAVLVGAGIDPKWENWTESANLINFTPHIDTPVLMINGRYDETHPFKTFVEPLYSLVKAKKNRAVYEGGHIPSMEFFSKTSGRWLSEQLGQPLK